MSDDKELKRAIIALQNQGYSMKHISNIIALLAVDFGEAAMVQKLKTLIMLSSGS